MSETKVLHILSGDLWAGAERMIWALINHLRGDRRLRILVMSLNEGTLSRKLRAGGVETIVIPESDNSFMRLAWKGFDLVRRVRPQVIHSHGYKQDILAAAVGNLVGVKHLACTIHGLPEVKTCSTIEKMKAKAKSKLDYWMLKRSFSGIVAVSEDVKSVLVGEYGFREKQVEVIYNGIDIPSASGTSKLRQDGRKWHIGTVGRMVPVKDYNLFLDVAAEIRKCSPNVRFSILGDGPEKERLMRRSRELGLHDCLSFESFREEPWPYYASLDIYVNTSVHEGIPLSILEAMACGVPVVAPRVGGIPEIITHGENGMLVDSREPKEVAGFCLKLLGNDEMRRSIGEKAAKKVECDFSTGRMAASYQRLYERLVAIG